VNVLNFLNQQSAVVLWLIFLVENLLVTVTSLLFGLLILKLYKIQATSVTSKEYWLCLLTNLINTAITYLGFWLWQHHYIRLEFSVSGHLVTDFFILFLAMDLAMYIFHYIIHHTAAYKAIHGLHHQYHNPSPIDLYVLHPLETVGFGALWLIVLSAYYFNFYAVIAYLTLNVIFGIIGHLGFEPLPKSISTNPFFKYWGTSSFHHNHHLDINCNFGFYTSIWDRLLGTYKECK
jgi:lathosterol oxidase